jgi:hypothetical protein
MTQQTIIVNPPNSGLGDTPYTAFNKINSNFNDLYGNGGSLPQATSLTGAELIIVSASGVPEYATTALIASLAAANPFTVGAAGNITPANLFAAGSFAGQFYWANGYPALQSSGQLEGCNNTVSGTFAWTNLDGTYTAQQPNPAGTNIAASVGMGIQSTGASNNSQAETSNTLWSPSGPTVALYRATSNGLGLGGFTMTLYFAFTTVIAAQSCFFGFCNSTAELGNIVPSALLNTVGLGKDSGDTNLSWYYNNGSGSATKVSLGVTPASLANQLLRLLITCDGQGNVVFTLTNMESGGSTVSTLSVPTATAKLPAANVLVAPHLYLNNNSAANCAYGVSFIYVTGGFIS